jgi:hypothetical protein
VSSQICKNAIESELFRTPDSLIPQPGFRLFYRVLDGNNNGLSRRDIKEGGKGMAEGDLSSAQRHSGLSRTEPVASTVSLSACPSPQTASIEMTSLNETTVVSADTYPRILSMRIDARAWRCRSCTASRLHSDQEGQRRLLEFGRPSGPVVDTGWDAARSMPWHISELTFINTDSRRRHGLSVTRRTLGYDWPTILRRTCPLPRSLRSGQSPTYYPVHKALNERYHYSRYVGRDTKAWN